MRLCYRNLPERLEVLNEAFQGAPLTLILFLRPQLPWLESNYIQLLQEAKGLTYPPEEFLSTALESPFLQWNELVDTVTREFRPHKFCVLEYSPRTAIKQFARECQIAPDGSAEFRSNTSVSTIRGLALSELTKDPAMDRRMLRFMLQSMVPPSGSQRRSPFTLDQQTAVLEHFRQDWERISQRQETVSAGKWEEWSLDEMARPLEPLLRENLNPDLLEEYLTLVEWFVSTYSRRVATQRRIHQLRHERGDLFRYGMERLRRSFSRD